MSGIKEETQLSKENIFVVLFNLIAYIHCVNEDLLNLITISTKSEKQNTLKNNVVAEGFRKKNIEQNVFQNLFLLSRQCLFKGLNK